MNKFKCNLAFLLAIIMVVTMLPMTVFAETEVEVPQETAAIQQNVGIQESIETQKNEDTSESEMMHEAGGVVVSDYDKNVDVIIEDISEIPNETLTEPEPESESEDETEQDASEDFTWSFDNGVLTISGKCTIDFECGPIPWKQYENDIKSIIITDLDRLGYNAFRNYPELTTVTLGEGMGIICDGCFAGCKKLEKIYFNAKNITSYGLDCFEDAGTDGNGVELLIGNEVSTIPGEIFSNLPITVIEIPSSVTSIGDNAFSGCSELERIVWNAKSCVVGHDIFPDSFNNDIEVIFGDSVESIPGKIFSNLPITVIEIPSSVKSIGERAFSGCTGLTSVEIPSSVTSIGNSAFYGCTGLTSVEIPSSVTSIGNFAFYGCTGLTSVDISNGVTSIGNSAFSGCMGLTNIKIPASVTSLGEHEGEVFFIGDEDGYTVTSCSVFDYCTNLASIEVDAKNPVYDSRNNCNSVIRTTDNKLLFGCSNSTIPDGVECICCSAFGYTNISDVTIPDSVTKIEARAFVGCDQIKTIKIPDSVKSIDHGTFSNCYKLQQVDIGDGVETIGYYAFSGCTSLTSLTLSKNVTTIKNYAFFNTALSEVHYNGNEKQKESMSVDADNTPLFSATWYYGLQNINYIMDGGENSPYNPSSYYESLMKNSSIALHNPTKTCARFVGWYTDKDFKNQVFEIAAGTTGEVTLYAKWSEAHDYVGVTPTFAWNGNECESATFRCRGCDNEESVATSVTEDVLIDPTCSSRGLKMLTAKCTFEGNEYKDTKFVSIPMTDSHDYEGADPTFAWDGYTCTKATIKCDNCAHKIEVSANVTEELAVEPGTESKGLRIYTAKCSYEGAEYSDIKLEVIPATHVKNKSAATDAVATDVEKQAIKDGATMSVWATYSDVTDSVSADVKKSVDAQIEEIRKTSNSATVFQYLDIDLCKQLSTSASSTQVTEAESMVTITIPVPESILLDDPYGEEDYYIVRVHEGQYDLLKLRYDTSKKLFSFDSDKFSEYAFVSVNAIESETVGDVNGNGAINVLDAQIAYDIAHGKYTDYKKYSYMSFRANVNSDESVDALDARAIQYYVHYGQFGK